MPEAQQLILVAEHFRHIKRDIGFFLLAHSCSNTAKTGSQLVLTK